MKNLFPQEVWKETVTEAKSTRSLCVVEHHNTSKAVSEYSKLLSPYIKKTSSQCPEGTEFTADTFSIHEETWKRLMKEGGKGRCRILQGTRKPEAFLPLEEAHTLRGD